MQYGKTAFTYAIVRGNIEIAQILVLHGKADINARDNVIPPVLYRL